MELQVFRAMWGALKHPQAEGTLPFEELLPIIKKLGFSGVEVNFQKQSCPQ